MVCPSRMRRKETSGRERARCWTRALMAPVSALSFFMNLSRAGVL